MLEEAASIHNGTDRTAWGKELYLLFTLLGTIIDAGGHNEGPAVLHTV
jgi:hypothetical protein